MNQYLYLILLKIVDLKGRKKLKLITAWDQTTVDLRD